MSIKETQVQGPGVLEQWFYRFLSDAFQSDLWLQLYRLAGGFLFS